MVKLSEFLSDESKKDLILGQVKVGDVFRMHLGKEEKVVGKDTSDDGRNKYFIIIGFDVDGSAIGLVLIDTKINPYLPQVRKELHYKLSADNYEFLNGKSRYVDCSDLKEISSTKFVSLFSGDKAKGHINDDDLKLIRDAIVSYEDAEPKLLKKFGLIRTR